MAALGLVIVWASYTLGMLGWTKVKHMTNPLAGPGQGKPLTFSDLALPSHRPTYLATFTAGPTTPPAVSANGVAAPPTVTGGNPITGGGTVHPPQSAFSSKKQLAAWLKAEYPWLSSAQITTVVNSYPTSSFGK